MKTHSGKNTPGSPWPMGYSVPPETPQSGEADDTAVVMMTCMRRLLFVTAVLAVFGLTMLYSASYGQAGLKYFRNQLIWVCLGAGAGAVVFFAGYRRIVSRTGLWMTLCFLALAAAAFLFEPVNGASRWLRFGPFSIQPSEFAKLATAFFIAKYCSDHSRSFSELFHRRGLLPLAGGILLMIGGILLGKDLGTTVLVLAMASATLFVAGIYLRYAVVPAAILFLFGSYVFFFDSTRMARVTSFLHPEKVQSGSGYQLWTSLMALGSGSWFGTGFMTSRMKERYLPEAHTDFIISVIGEELGLLGVVAVLVLYTLWGYYALRIATKSPSRLGMLLGFAIAFVFTCQAAINIAVVSGSVPTKGMPAPFISYGGSNMIVALTAVGVLISIAVDGAFPGYSERMLSTAAERTKSFFRSFKRF